MRRNLSSLVKAKIKAILCASLEVILARPLYVKSERVRRLIFDVLASNPNTTLIYTNFGPEQYLVDSHDQTGGKIIFSTGECEIHKFVLAIKLLRKHELYDDGQMLLIDVGANIGFICIPAAARGYVKCVIAIEPHPDNCRLLRANVALNGLTKTVSVHESACGMFDGEKLELELSEDNFGDHRIHVNDAPGRYNENRRRTIQIQSDTLDTVCALQRSQKSFIWMDTQGYEGHVLAGGRRWLEAGTPLCLEFWPYGMKRATNSFQLMKSALVSYAGFYDLENPEKFRPIEDLDDLYTQIGEAGRFTDILVLSRQRDFFKSGAAT
jgi:FkbM family methyltransferase